MSWEYASPAQCLADLDFYSEGTALDPVRLNAFTQHLRRLVFRPQDVLGNPFYAYMPDLQPYEIGEDGARRLPEMEGGSPAVDAAADLDYGMAHPNVRGFLQFYSAFGFTTAASRAYIPDGTRINNPNHRQSIEDIVEAATDKKIQAALTWNRSLNPAGPGSQIDVHKRYFFLGTTEESAATEAVCVAVYSHHNSPEPPIEGDVLEDPIIIEDIAGHLSAFRVPVTRQDIERLEHRVHKNEDLYTAVAKGVRRRTLGRLAAFAYRANKADRTPYGSDFGTVMIRLIEERRSETLEDDAADGADGDFSIFSIGDETNAE